MSYLDQRISPARIWAIVIVAVVHVLIGIAFVTGFYQKFTGDPKKDLKSFDVEEPPPPEEELPPPEETPEPASPEIVTPPPAVRTPPPPQQMQTTQVPPPPAPPTMYVAPTPNPGPPPTPPTPPPVVVPPPVPPPTPPASPPTPARLRSGSISNADYPASAIRAEAEGTTRITLQVAPNGSVSGCSVSGSSGNSALDSTACSLARRRFRFAPATRNGQPVAGSYSTSVRWQLQDDR